MKNVVLQELQLTGFKAFRSTVTVQLHDPNPTLVFLTGENRLYPEMGANAVGKSSLLDGLCWVLYGQTARGVRAGSLSSGWGNPATSYCGGLKFTVNGVSHHLRRQWKPNGLELDGSRVAQEAVDSLLGLNYDGFVATVLVPQSGVKFPDLRPAERERALSEFLHLDDWIKRSQAASSLATSARAEAVDAERAGSRAQGILDGIDLGGIRSDYRKWQRSRSRAAETARKQLAAAEQELRKATATAQEARQNAAAAEGRVGQRVAEVRRLRGILGGLATDQQRTSLAVGQARAELKELKRQILALGQISGALCPTCGQPVTPEHAEAEGRKLAKLVADARKRLQEKISEADAVDDLVVKTESEVRSAEKAESEARSEKTESEVRSAREGRSVTAAEWEVKRAVDAVTVIEAETNPLERRLREAEAEFEKATREVRRTGVRRYFLRQREEALKFWTKGFRDIRFSLLAGAVSHLEQEVSTVLATLGLASWSIKFLIENDSSGNSSLRTVVSNADTGPEGVQWESWSGGEEQRLRLAMIMGLSSMLSTLNGVRFNVEFWDEPTTHLSKVGVEGLVETLYYRARETGRSVWLIDHNVIESEAFGRVLSVVREDSGSVVRQAK